MTSGTPPARNTRIGRVADRAVRQRIDQPRHLAVDRGPVVDGGPLHAGMEGDGRRVKQQIRAAAERRVDGHRVVERGFGQDVLRGDAAVATCSRVRAAERRAMSSQIGWPDGRERRVRQAEPEGFADDLRRGRGAEELAAAAGRCAGVAARLRGLFQRDFAVGDSGRRWSAPSRCLRRRLRPRA